MITLETKSERITARITPKQKRFLKQAADLRGRSLTDFLVDSAQKEAENAIIQSLVMQFTIEQQEQMVNTLLNPPEPNDALKEATQLYQQSDITSR